MSNKTLTIFTPTYNRVDTLERLYASLLRQTVGDFKWMVVDDGSTDGTAEWLKETQKEQRIEIETIKQPNSGKYVAHNRAVEACDTELFCCVDSDDYLLDHAVEKVIETHKANGIAVIAYITRRQFPDGRLNDNGRYFTQTTVAPFNDLHIKHGYSGDTMIVFLTEKIKKYAFPFFPGEKFVTENVLYYQLQSDDPAMFLPDSYYVGEYREDGLTKNLSKLYSQNIRSCAYYAKQRASVRFLPINERIRAAIHYCSLCLLTAGRYDISFPELAVPTAILAIGKTAAPIFKKKYEKIYGL